MEHQAHSVFTGLNPGSLHCKYSLIALTNTLDQLHTYAWCIHSAVGQNAALQQILEWLVTDVLKN